MVYDQLICYYGNYCAVDHTVAIYPTKTIVHTRKGELKSLLPAGLS